MRRFPLFPLVFIASLASAGGGLAQTCGGSFNAFVEGLKREAMA